MYTKTYTRLEARVLPKPNLAGRRPTADGVRESSGSVCAPSEALGESGTISTPDFFECKRFNNLFILTRFMMLGGTHFENFSFSLRIRCNIYLNTLHET